MYVGGCVSVRGDGVSPRGFLPLFAFPFGSVSNCRIALTHSSTQWGGSESVRMSRRRRGRERGECLDLLALAFTLGGVEGHVAQVLHIVQLLAAPLVL